MANKSRRPAPVSAPAQSVGPRPELLAPAGSLEAFFAALESGADAVYCGLQSFSARARARNINLSDLEQMLGYAGARDRRIYVTVNTLIKERELPELIDTLGALEALGVHGVILQDLAVWRLARRHFPALPLHASTQMTVHNAAGVQQLERMGFKRAVLARELTLPEIAAIRARSSIELEHFVHGALCLSFSGQCYFSSWLGGKSGNRGRCAQPCRRRYHQRGKPGYYLSPNDLSGIDLLPELAQAGIGSLKIEGRMKSAEYVAQVVSAYRLALDAAPNAREAALRQAKERLKDSFGRTPTRGFLGGPTPTDMVVPARAGATGRFLGTLDSERDGQLRFTTRASLRPGDRIRVQPQNDEAGSAFTIRQLFVGRKSVREAAAGTAVAVASPFRGQFTTGDAIFKVSSDAAFTLSDSACRKRLQAAPPRPVNLTLTLEISPECMRLCAIADGLRVEAEEPLTSYPAEQQGLSAAVLEKVFAATGDTPLRLVRLETGPLPDIVIPPSRLKEIRRSFYQRLWQQLNDQRQERRQTQCAAAQAELTADTKSPAAPSTLVLVGQVRDAHLLADETVDRIGLPLTPSQLRELGAVERRLARQRAAVVWDIPFVLLDADWQAARTLVRELVERGYTAFRLNNIGHLPLFDGLDTPLQLMTGFRLFSLNHQAILAWRELGLAEVTLYLEDDRENLRALLDHGTALPPNLVIYSAVPVMTTRVPLTGLKPGQPLVSDRDEGYRVRLHDGLTDILAQTDFSLTGQRAQLEQLGLRRFTLDLGHCGPFSPAGKRALTAFRQGQAVAGTSRFNFDGELE